MSEQEFGELFARRLRFYLDMNDMSQRELAQKLGVSTAAVSQWCTGVKTPRMDKIDAMCALFGCKRADFYEEPDSDSYYLDPDTAQKAQELFEDEDLRVLFDAARGSRPQDLQMAADLLRRLKETNPNG